MHTPHSPHTTHTCMHHTHKNTSTHPHKCINPHTHTCIHPHTNKHTHTHTHTHTQTDHTYCKGPFKMCVTAQITIFGPPPPMSLLLTKERQTHLKNHKSLPETDNSDDNLVPIQVDRVHEWQADRQRCQIDLQVSKWKLIASWHTFQKLNEITGISTQSTPDDINYTNFYAYLFPRRTWIWAKLHQNHQKII